jgi:hypothetical protein
MVTSECATSGATEKTVSGANARTLASEMSWYFGAIKMRGKYAGPHVNCRFGGGWLDACFDCPSPLFRSFRAAGAGGKGILSAFRMSL